MQKKKTLRSELIRIMVITSSITFILIGGILSMTIFRWSSDMSWKDMEFYMNSIQEQLADKLLFVEEGAVFLKNNGEMESYFRYGEGEDERIEALIAKNINLFSDRNMVSDGSPIVRDVYVFSKDARSVGVNFYPEGDTSYKAKTWKLQKELAIYSKKNIPFYYWKSGNELNCIFTIYDNGLKPMGYCAIVYNLESIEKIFAQLEKYETYYWAFESTDGRIVGGTGFPGKDAVVFEDKVGQVKYGKDNYFYSMQNNSFGLTSYILIPREKMYLEIAPALQMAGVVSLSVFFAILLVINHFVRKISAPMQSIVDKLDQFGTGDFDTTLGEYQIEEFQQISRSFNDMTVKIKQLIKEVYEIKLRAQESKIQYLQAQMNPHFMFNILSMIAIRVKMSKDEGLFKIVTAFAGLMQGKLFRKNEVEILLEEEMEIVGFYLLLQGERFKDMITYEIKWESEDLKTCMIPRLCVEPLVENAMLHGLEPKGEEGSVYVEIKKEDEKTLYIIVTDDGVGFDMEKVNLQDEAKSPRVGIMNIQRLVQNLYGDEYGLKIESKPGIGTKMELRLPFKKERTW